MRALVVDAETGAEIACLASVGEDLEAPGALMRPLFGERDAGPARLVVRIEEHLGELPASLRDVSWEWPGLPAAGRWRTYEIEGLASIDARHRVYRL